MLVQFSNRQKGLLFAIAAPLFYSLKSIAIKAAPYINMQDFLFLRFFFDFLILIPFFIKYRQKITIRKIHVHLVRAILVILSIFCSIYGLKNLILIDAILLENTLPLFIPLVMLVWYRKKISIKSFFALLSGFTALFLLLKPKLDVLHLAGFASLSVGLLAAITSVSIRSLSKTEHPIAILFYLNLFSGLISGVPCFFLWKGGYPASFWAYFILISSFGVLFQYSIIRAYSLVLPHIVGCLTYFSVLFSIIFGWLIWKESLDILQILGGGILIFSGLLITYENKKFAELSTEIISEKSG